MNPMNPTSDTGWEARMARSAREHGYDWSSVYRKEFDTHWADLIRQEWALQAAMTLGQAAAWLRTPPFGCACTGFPDCCRYRDVQANRLQRAAHITVKLFADLAMKKARAAA